MKPDSKKGQPLLIAMIAFSVITIIFAVLSILNIENSLVRIMTQASLSLTLMTNGIYILLYQKQNKLGYFLLGVSALILIVMIFIVYTRGV